MPNIEKSIFIHAAPEAVFAYMADPIHLLEIWPSLQEIKNVQPLPKGGYCYEWTYKMGGIRFHGQAEWIEFVKNRRVVDQNQSDSLSTITWEYIPEEGGTQVRLNIDYTLSESVLRRLSEPVLHKMNEYEAAILLANLKVRMEG